MNVRRSLGSLFRGWLPKEANTCKIPVKAGFNANSHKYLKINSVPPQLGPGTIRVTRFLALQTVLFTFMCVTYIFQIGNGYNITPTLLISLITVGLMVGSIFSAIFTQRQINFFERNSHFSLPKPETVFAFLLAFIGIILAVASLSFILFLPDFLMGLLITLFAAFPTFVITRYLLFLRYEKIKEIYIFQYWLQTGYFAVPKKTPDEVSNPVLLNQGKTSSTIQSF